MAYDPFSTVPKEETETRVIEKTVEVPGKPNMLFGVIEDKLFFGILMGIIIAEIIFKRG